jgi:phosphatidylserine decarboxylase
MNDILRSIREGLPRIHRDGWRFIILTLALAVAIGVFFVPAFWLLLILAGWMAAFFRDPVRIVPVGLGLIVSPADGRIEPIAERIPPAELGLGGSPLLRVSIFMNVFDCHINRAPAAGRVSRVAYRAGAFLNADLDKASEANERNALAIDTDFGPRIGVVQIAGLVARRIVCWTPEGGALRQGERFGMIRFGSRLDVYLPEGSIAVASAGQRAIAGETVIALLPGAALAPPLLTQAE